jgi:hypothetical protein
VALISKKKNIYPIGVGLRSYLLSYGREVNIPVHYHELLRYTSSIALYDSKEQDTYWETVFYEQSDREEIHLSVKMIYALLKAGGDMSVMDHLYIDRIDLCVYGNTQPFRVRMVNKINDNFDYFYIKNADASRVYGLELEDLLSPNRIRYLVHQNTLIEEHVAGIPGEKFMRLHMDDPNLNPIPQDIIPFEIINYPATSDKQEYLYFRAYLDTLGDTYNGEWSGTKYIGRAEELYNYTGFKRSLTFGFKVAAHSAQELKPLYEKLNRLAGTTAPTYQDGLFMQGVFSKITIGDYIQKLPGFFTSVAFAWQTAYPWEIGNVDTGSALDSIPRVPHILDVSVSFQPIHDFAPQYNKTFIGFPSNSALPLANV